MHEEVSIFIEYEVKHERRTTMSCRVEGGAQFDITTGTVNPNAKIGVDIKLGKNK